MEKNDQGLHYFIKVTVFQSIFVSSVDVSIKSISCDKANI
jgi:hypothetical protein